MLNQSQLQAIIAKLKDSGLNYQEVYEELLDHYASAIEEKMKEGQSFNDSLAAVHQDFGGRKGLKDIEKRYYRQIYHQYRQMQWKNLKRQFHWPQTIGSITIGLLVYCLATLLQDTRIIKLGVIVVAFIPVLLAFFEYYRILKKSTYSNRSAKGSLLIHISSLGLNVLTLLILGPKVFFGELFEGRFGIDILALYPAAISVVLTFYILYILSFSHSLQHIRASLS